MPRRAPPRSLLLQRRSCVALLLAAASFGPLRASAKDANEAAATELAQAFLDLVDASQGEEALLRHGAEAADTQQALRRYLVARLGIGNLSNRRIIEAKKTATGWRLLVRYNAPDSPRQGTNNRKLARHNEFLELADSPSGPLKVAGFGFAD